METSTLSGTMGGPSVELSRRSARLCPPPSISLAIGDESGMRELRLPIDGCGATLACGS